nr:uncharacterized protein [Tanacetum cinerariifolium]
MVCTRPDIASTDVGILDGFDRGLQTYVQVFVDFDYAMAGYMTFTEAWKKKMWLNGLLTESRYELRLVACIAIGALVKGGSRSEVPAQVDVAAYRKWRGWAKKIEASHEDYKYVKRNRNFTSVLELKANWIFLKCTDDDSLNEDIKFHSHCCYGELELARRAVSINTKAIYLNMIAYELCPHNPNDFRVSTYIRVMKILIRRPYDVNELRNSKILLHSLDRDEEAVKMYAEIETPAVNIYMFNQLRREIERHRTSRYKMWASELMMVYLISPWKVVALAVSTAILVTSLLQTYFARSLCCYGCDFYSLLAKCWEQVKEKMINNNTVADVAKYGRTNNRLEERSGDSKPNEGMNTQPVRDNANVFQSFNSYDKAVLGNKSVGVSGNNDASNSGEKPGVSVSNKANEDLSNEALMFISKDDCIDLDGMECSILAKVKDLSVIADLLKYMSSEGFVDVGLRYVGGRWVWLEFDSTDQVESVKNSKVLNELFLELKDVSYDFISDERCVWIDLVGLPLAS